MRAVDSPISDPVNPSAEGPSVEEVSARPGVVTFAATLARALETAKLYETQHPLVAKLCDEACEALRSACGQGEEVSLGVGPGRLYDADARFSEPAEIAALAQAWHAADLGQVTFVKTLDPAKLRDAVAAWLTASNGPAELCEQLDRVTGGGIRAEPLHYDRLRTTESVDEAQRSSWSWRSLFDDALDLGANDTRWEAALSQLTDQLTEAVEASAEDAIEGLHREMHAALTGAIEAKSTNMPRTSVQGTVHRLGRLLETLSPALRERLLAAAPRSPGVDVSESHSTERDFAAVLAAVQGLDGQLTEATCESLRMCQKLAVLAEGLGEETDSACGDDLLASLQELLDQHGPADFTPEAYRRRLDEISAGIDHVDPLSEKMRAAFDPDVVRDHAFELALHLATAGHGEPGPEAWNHLRRRQSDLVQRAEIASIARATRAAEARLARGGPEDTLAACRAWVRDLQATLAQDGRLGALLDASRDPEDTATLLRYADESVLHEAVRRLADAENDAGAVALAEPLRNLGGMLNTIAELLIAEAPERRLPLVRRLAPVTFATATRWLGPLLTQKDPVGRAEAFAALVEASPAWPADAAEGLLQHPDENVRSAALHRLLRQADPASLAAIGRLLTGESTGRAPTSALIDRAVAALLAQAGPGHSVLRSVLTDVGQRRFGKRRQTLDPMIQAIRKHADVTTQAMLLRSVSGATE